ncbi:MAG TPA: DUF2690 domain-containing protein [Trebonia sp.]|nr:DUF2690 domain-containing protein [Trebonia sp.]
MVRLGRLLLSRKIMLMATAGALALAAVAGATPARAADQDDPYVRGCTADAYAVSSAYIKAYSPNASGNTGFGELHLMYSPSCNTNWAEFDNYPKGYKFLLVAWSHDASGSSTDMQSEPWTSNGDEVAWTDMVNGANPAGVGVCEYSTSGAVLNGALLAQSAGDLFGCSANQLWWWYWPGA